MWEFAVVGRKQLGYRVQMDTRIAPGSDSAHSAGLALLTRGDGSQLTDASLVLVRIDNTGTTHLVGEDYISVNERSWRCWTAPTRARTAAEGATRSPG